MALRKAARRRGRRSVPDAPAYVRSKPTLTLRGADAAKLFASRPGQRVAARVVGKITHMSMDSGSGMPGMGPEKCVTMEIHHTKLG